ncbi:hypothetical protein [Botrimarina sp.]|uniref:hypothetical protein n=1 Tax=Botrimarina sp. TaxID=2795802 RepID=UPI0032EC09B5
MPEALLHPPPVAWLQEIGSIVVLLIVVARQVMVAFKEQKEAEEAKRRAAERAEKRGQQGGQQGGRPVELPPRQVVRDQRADAHAGRERQAEPVEAKADQGELRSEVEEFLRRVGQMQEEQAVGPARPEPDEPPQRPRRRGPLDPFEEPPRRKPTARPKRPAPESQIELLVDPDEAASRADEAIQQRRLQEQRDRQRQLRHLPESQLAEQAAHLGESIALADDRLEERLQQTFEHRLGRLGSRPAAAAAEFEAPRPASTAARIRALLKTPAGVRDAVILSEILRRPGERP